MVILTIIFVLSAIDIFCRGFKRENLALPVVAAALAFYGDVEHLRETRHNASEIAAANRQIENDRAAITQSQAQHAAALDALRSQAQDAVNSLQGEIVDLRSQLTQARSLAASVMANERDLSDQTRSAFAAYSARIAQLDERIITDQQRMTALQVNLGSVTSQLQVASERVARLEPRAFTAAARAQLVAFAREHPGRYEIYSEPGVDDAGPVAREIGWAVVEAGSPTPTWDPTYVPRQAGDRILVQGPDPMAARALATVLMSLDRDTKYVNESVGDHITIYLAARSEGVR